MTLLFILLIVYQLKHFFADYPLQVPYMLNKFKPGWDFFLPLVAHASVHAAMTAIICWVVNPSLMWLALVDGVVHFIMDRIKAGTKYLGRFKSITPKDFQASMEYLSWEGHEREKKEAKKKLRHNTLFWWSLGFDQMVHHLTHYFIIYMLITG